MILKSVIALVFLVLALANQLMPNFVLKPTTIALVIMAFLPFGGEFLKSLELPGGMKVTFQEMQKLQKDLNKIKFLHRDHEITVNTPKMKKAALTASRPSEKLSFMNVNDSFGVEDEIANGGKKTRAKEIEKELDKEFNIDDGNARVALIELRAYVEKVLTLLAQEYGIEFNDMPVLKILKALHEQNIFTAEEVKALKELIDLCNRAIHGVDNSQETIAIVNDIAGKLIKELNDRVLCVLG